MWIERLERNMQVACSLRRDFSTNYYTTLKEKRKEKRRKKIKRKRKRTNSLPKEILLLINIEEIVEDVKRVVKTDSKPL
jgi:hypothetical protein